MSVPTWPESATSRVLPKYIDWQRASPDAPATLTTGMANNLPPIAIQSLFNRHTYLFEKFTPDVQKVLEARRDGRNTSTTVLVPVKIKSITRRMEEIEDIRATIPVEACLKMLLEGASTGEMDGTMLQAKERIDILKYLVNRVIPEAKSIDTIERGTKLDRVRRAAADGSIDLKKLSVQELLDMDA